MGLSYQRNPSEPMQPTQALKAPNLVTAFTQILHHQLLRYIAAIRARQFIPKPTPFLPRRHWRRQQDHIPIGFFKTCEVTKLRWDGVVSPFDDYLIDCFECNHAIAVFEREINSRPCLIFNTQPLLSTLLQQCKDISYCYVKSPSPIATTASVVLAPLRTLLPAVVVPVYGSASVLESAM